MASRYHDVILVLVFLLSVATCSVAELLCHPLLTALVRGFEYHGVLTANQYTFTQNYYEKFNSTHYRVCICTKISCLRKCCPPGEAFDSLYKKSCQYRDLDIRPDVFTENLDLIPNYGVGNFYRVYGDTCKHGRYLLEPEFDIYYLFVNGSLLILQPNVNLIYDTSLFCFENIIIGDEAESNNKFLGVLVCFPENPVPPEKQFLYPIGMIISMPFLLVTFIVYSLPELRNLHGKNLMSHVASLLTGYILLVANNFKIPVSDTVCIICGFMVQYSFLASYFWLNVMCFDIWSTFSGFGKVAGHARQKENKRFIWYSIYAWGCPAIIMLVTIAMDYAPNIPDFIIKPNIGNTMCFFDSKMAILVYFYVPMAIIVLCDITFFTLTAIKIFKVRRETKVLTRNDSRRHDETSKQRYNLYLKLFMVMGINWVMEIISWALEGPKWLWIATDTMNCLQGLFIFWIFVCSRKVKQILMLRCCPRWVARNTEMSTSSLKMTMSGNSSGPITADSIHLNSAGTRKPRQGSRSGT